MRFVIATLPDLKYGLGRDLDLVKACALYGDAAVLYSPTYDGIEPLLDFSGRPLLHRLVYLALLMRDPGFVIGEALTEEERATRIENARRRSKNLQSKAARVSELLCAPLGEDVRAELDRIALEVRPLTEAFARFPAGQEALVWRARELAKANEMGLVRIVNIHESPSVFFSKEKLESLVRDQLCRADSYGALDERFIGDFKHLSGGPTHKLRLACVGAEVFERLPGFSEATLEEIRDIRHELARYLEAFRKALVEMSLEIESAPWDRDFPHDVERELRLRVHPAVEEITTRVGANSYLRELAHRMATKPLAVPATSALGLVLSNTADIPAAIGQVLAGLAGAGLLALDTYKAWVENRSQIERNELFFYYRTSRLLGK